MLNFYAEQHSLSDQNRDHVLNRYQVTKTKCHYIAFRKPNCPEQYTLISEPWF